MASYIIIHKLEWVYITLEYSIEKLGIDSKEKSNCLQLNTEWKKIEKEPIVLSTVN